MSVLPQHITDLVDSLIREYPTGLPEGIHMNINVNVQFGSPAEGDLSVPVEIGGDQPEPPIPVRTAPSYKGPFLGLYRVIAKNEARRIKIRSDSDLAAPEAVISLTDSQYVFLKALNPGRFSFFESSGYLFKSDNARQSYMYKQFGFENQMLVIAEIKRVGSGTLGRVVGIGTDPYLSDPKPLDSAVTNNKTTPWLVHLVGGVQVYAPILASENTPGWVNMQEVEKIR